MAMNSRRLKFPAMARIARRIAIESPVVAQFEFPLSRWGHPELAKDLARGGHAPCGS